MMRYPWLFVPLLVALAVAGPASAETDEPTTDPEASKTFEVRLTPGMTEEDVTEQIIAAGREQLVTACAPYPGATVRIFTPLASGSYDDVACSTILEAGISVGQSREALTSSDEHLGKEQQRLTPIGLGCSLVMLGLGIFMNHAMCQRPGAENPSACAALSEYGMGGLGLACAFI
jgi:hypothetical protein